MAKRLSVKEMMEAARKGGAAQQGDNVPNADAVVVASEPVAHVEAMESQAVAQPKPVPAAAAPSGQELGRPLTLKEKLAAARSGAGPASAVSAPAARTSEEAPAAAKPKAVPAPAASLGRPLTMAEKLAAARGGASAPAATSTGANPIAAKPAAAKTVVAKRELPPLSELSDPKDVAEAARQAAAKKTVGADSAAKPAAAKAAKEKDTKPQTVLPRPARAMAMARDMVRRRQFLKVPWIGLGWGSFITGSAAFTAMMGRFMFPNVLAEPPSTIKVGLPTNYEAEGVSERFKTDWGFWIVRSTRYNGEDVIYALQSVCTHLGCPPNWLAGEQKFKCPCHGSGFYISGVNFEGPAPRPLERFKVTTGDDGQIVVDKSAKFQEELGQWSDPSSFITA